MSANMYDAWDCGDRPAIREQLKQREDIIRLAREAEASFETAESMFKFAALHRDHLLSTDIHSCHADCQRFACVQTRKAVEAEREKVAAWMIERSYATGHGDTTEDLLKQPEWQVRESEREACVKLCEEVADIDWYWDGAMPCVKAIRARGQE